MPLTRKPLVEDVVDYIVKKILFSEQYKQGDWLNETEITKELGLSKAPVREAMRILAQQGLVQLVPNKGVFVRVISREELQEIGAIRLALEGILFKEILKKDLFAENDYARLENIVIEMDKIARKKIDKTEKVRLFMEQDVQFHEHIWQMTGLQWVKKILSEMYALIALGRFEILKKENIAEIVEKHRNVLEALRERNLEKIYKMNATILMRE